MTAELSLARSLNEERGMSIHRGSLLLCLACLAVLCSVGASWRGEGVVRGTGAGKNVSHSWICHLNKGYNQGSWATLSQTGCNIAPCFDIFSLAGTGGSVDKDLCKAPCNGTSDHHVYLGYIGALVAVVFFGSNFVPVKKYETGDGMANSVAPVTPCTDRGLIPFK